jgi:hypothetical protein
MEKSAPWRCGLEARVIRQTISCDICKSEKRQSNHWFVAFEQGMELRLSGWSSRYRTRPGAKHLCGQACVYRLMEDFMARVAAMKPEAEREKTAPERSRVRMDARPDGRMDARMDTSLTSNAAYIEVESARVIRPAAELVTMPGKPEAVERPAQLDEAPVYGSRNWRVEAWERERGREQREGERKPDLVARHGI